MAKTTVARNIVLDDGRKITLTLQNFLIPEDVMQLLINLQIYETKTGDTAARPTFSRKIRNHLVFGE